MNFEEVVLPHLDEVYDFAAWLMRGTQDAEDVVQEAMLRALLYFPSFSGTNARAWLFQIVRHVAYATLDQRRHRIHVPLEGEGTDDEGDSLAEGLIDPDGDPEALLEQAERRRELGSLLRQLPILLRECLILREIEEFSYREISQIIDRPVGTVMSRLWRARRLLVKLAARGRT